MKTLAFCVLSFILTVGAYAHNHPEAPPPPRDGAIQPWAHDRMRARGLFIICRDLVLDRYDADGDHKLSNQELDAIREEVARRMNARRKDMIQKFDKDKDGNLSKEERRHMRQEWRRRRPEMSLRMQQHHANMLQQYDVDKDGILSRGERRKMYADWAKRHPELAKKIEERRRAMRKRYDANQDGKLSPAEYQAMIKEQGKRPRNAFRKEDLPPHPPVTHRNSHQNSKSSQFRPTPPMPPHNRKEPPPPDRAVMILGHDLMMEKYDTNKDGKLSQEEKAILQADIDKLPPPPHHPQEEPHTIK